MYKKILKVLLTYLVLYLLNFFIVPYIYELTTGYYYVGATASVISYVVTFVVFLIGMWFITDALIAWLSCYLFYILLMFMYIPMGSYGIGMRMKGFFQSAYDPEAVSIHIMIVAGVGLFISIVAWILVKIGKKLQKKLK